MDGEPDPETATQSSANLTSEANPTGEANPTPEANSSGDAPTGLGTFSSGGGRTRRRRRRLRTLVISLAVLLVLVGGGVIAEVVYYDGSKLPSDLTLSFGTTLYYRDGHTVLARLGANRTEVRLDDLPPAVVSGVVAARDPGYLNGSTPWLLRLVRAQVNAATVGHTPTRLGITEQYAVLTGDGSVGRVRAAAIAARFEAKYTRRQILGFYLNTAYFGRAAYGIEAAANAYFGKSATELSLSEAMVLGGVIDADSPPSHADLMPNDPSAHPAQARARWEQTRTDLAATEGVDAATLSSLAYPNTSVGWTPGVDRSLLDRPTGFVVSHVLSELMRGPLQGLGYDGIVNGGFDIVTTIDVADQQVVESLNRRDAVESRLASSPPNVASAAVVVEPGTGRVLAYYGGPDGTGADEAGWFYNHDGEPTGYGFHPPGATFETYTLAAGLKKGSSLLSYWDASPAVTFPASGRTVPVRNGAHCPTGKTSCSLLDSFRSGLNTPFFGLTLKVGVDSVVKMANDAGIDDLWTVDGKRVALASLSQAFPTFDTEVGIGQYPVTVLDQANGMATFAAGGQRAGAHFVEKVMLDGATAYSETVSTRSIGLNPDQLADLTFAMSSPPPAGRLGVASANGSWQAGPGPAASGTWTVGFTTQLGIAVWVGTRDGTPLRTPTGAMATASTFAAPIFQAIAGSASSTGPPAQGFRPPGYTGDPESGNTPAPNAGAQHPGSTPTPASVTG
jgi:membrane peptidoglycan carboxypeptidase